MPRGIKADLIGKRFGYLTVVGRTDAKRKHALHWLCACDCGSTNVVSSGNLNAGNVRSCGRTCTARFMSPEVKYTRISWAAMMDRCERAQHHRYGGRGIKVCKRWKKFPAFLSDMGLRPHGYTIGRKDNDGDYEPSNCRWETTDQQNANKSDNVVIESNGRKQTVTQWAKELGMSRHRIYGRIKQGYTGDALLSTETFVRRATQTHCKYGHALYPDNFYLIGKNSHACKTCAKARARRQKQMIREQRHAP